MKWILITLLTVSLAGCLFGNAEGYGNRPNAKANTAPPANSQTYYTYYLLDPEYQCTVAGDTKTVPSYRQSIQIFSEKQTAYLLGDRCKPTKVEIPMNEIMVSGSQQYIGY